MGLYVGIDLHSSSSYIGILNEEAKRIMGRRVCNERESILMTLSPYKTEVAGVVVESTYNWYWLVDALMEEGYRVHLANPAAIQQYQGIKYLNDRHDAFWLAEMLRLAILPEGYIYPRESRGVRDLLRQRGRLVSKKTSLKLMLQNITSNQNGRMLSNNRIDQMTGEEMEKVFQEEEWRMNGMSLFSTIEFISKEIEKIESYVLKRMKEEWAYQGLQTVPGIGKILGLTIALETGPIERFPSAGQYASYSRCVPSAYWSNEKKKGSGNQKNGNKYLSWAFAEAGHFCIRYCEEAKRYYQRKTAQTNIPSAYRAISNKLSKACYHIMKDGREFDVRRLFMN